MPPSLPAKPNYPLNYTDLDSQLTLMQLALGLLQKNVSQEVLRFEARKEFRGGRGKNNKAGAWRKDTVKKLEIPKINITTSIANLDQDVEEKSTETAAIAETSKPSLKRLSKTEIEEYLKNVRGNKIFVEGIDFSEMDLSNLDLNNLSFSNCNFSGAKFPSIDSVFFDNSCNLEGSDFSNITIGKVFFGGKTTQDIAYDLVYNIGKNQILMSRAVKFDDDHQFQSFKSDIDKKSQSKIQSEIIDLQAKARQKPVILKVTNANFSSTKFENFWASNADFSSSNFADARIRINQGFPESGSKSIDMFDVDGVDLTGAFFEIYDNQGKKIQETHGAQSFNSSNINPDLKCVIGNCGVMSQEFIEKMQSGREIVILINADNQKIPKGLKMQSADPNYKDFEFTSHQDLKATELKSAELCNHYFGRYNIKFVTEEMLDGQEPDQILHLNFFNLKVHAVVDFNNFYGFGNKETVISFNTELTKQDFWSIFLHEMSHMFFQHPKTLASLSYPTKISYLPPMVMRPDSNSVMVANNFIPIVTPTIVDQKLLQDYMKTFGREAFITHDIETKYNSERIGIQSSHNPNKDFQNIVSFSSQDFDDKNEIVIMSGANSLAFCLESNYYGCNPALGLEESQAILIMDKETGAVKSMFLLSGENSKIKIDEQIFDLKDFQGENIFSILRKNEQGDIGFDKFQDASGSEAGFFLENKILKDHEDIERQKLDSPRPKIIAKSEGESGKDLSFLMAAQLGITLTLIASGVLCYKAQRGLRATQSSRPANAESTHAV